MSDEDEVLLLCRKRQETIFKGRRGICGELGCFNLLLPKFVDNGKPYKKTPRT